MASVSPGSGSSSQAGKMQQGLSKVEQYYLSTQAELSAWMKPQPGENQVKTVERVARVRALIVKAVGTLRTEMARLSELRNQRDPLCREEMEKLQDKCLGENDFLVKLLNGAPGDVEFAKPMLMELQRMRKDMTQAVRKQQRNTGPQPSAAQRGQPAGTAQQKSGSARLQQPQQSQRQLVQPAAMSRPPTQLPSGQEERSGCPAVSAAGRLAVDGSPIAAKAAVLRAATFKPKLAAAEVHATKNPVVRLPRLDIGNQNQTYQVPLQHGGGRGRGVAGPVHQCPVSADEDPDERRAAVLAKHKPGSAAKVCFPSDTVDRGLGRDRPQEEPCPEGRRLAGAGTMRGGGLGHLGVVVEPGKTLLSAEQVSATSVEGGATAEASTGPPIGDEVAKIAVSRAAAAASEEAQADPAGSPSVGDSLPNEQVPDWGESQMGPVPEDCAAMNFIKALEGEGQDGVQEMDEDPCPQRGQPDKGQEPPVEAEQPPTPRASVTEGLVGEDGGLVVQNGGEREGAMGDGQGATSGPSGRIMPQRQVGTGSALIKGQTFASVVGARARSGPGHPQKGGAAHQAHLGDQATNADGWSRGVGGLERKRRNVVQLRYRGPGACPPRGEVVDKILSLGIRPEELFALIHPYNSKDFDVSFHTAMMMDTFLARWEGVKGTEVWVPFEVVPLSRQDDIKRVTILVRNESIPQQDICTWLERYGKLSGPLRKALDEKKIWTGAWLAQIKLNRVGCSVSHIPASTFIGRDRVLAFYQGQPRLCFKCGSPTHYSADCTAQRCVRCGGSGHPTEGCDQIRCNLCGVLGHPFSRCPKAFRGPTPAAEEEMPVAPGMGARVHVGGPMGRDKVQEKGKGGQGNEGPVTRSAGRRATREGGGPPGGASVKGPVPGGGPPPSRGTPVVAPEGLEVGLPDGGDALGVTVGPPEVVVSQQKRARGDSEEEGGSTGGSSAEEGEEEGDEVEMQDPEWEMVKRKRRVRRVRPKGENPQVETHVGPDAQPSQVELGRYGPLQALESGADEAGSPLGDIY